MFPAASYDPDTLAVLTRAFNDAWIDIQAMVGAKPVTSDAIRSSLVKRIMEAANRGERDPRRLKLIALKAIE
jgi:hypothetical protein